MQIKDLLRRDLSERIEEVVKLINTMRDRLHPTDRICRYLAHP